MKFSFVLAISVSTLITSCHSDVRKIEREGEPDIYTIQDNDVEMNRAIVKARTTLTEFNAALKSRNPDFINFALKVRFNTLKGGEHIWVSQISVKNDEYYGVADNVSESITEVKFGDKIKIDKSRISDWMFIEKGKLLRGGYTKDY